MSTSQITKMESNCNDVIVRAFGGEPVRLKAVEVGESVVQAYGSDPQKTMGFPAEDVFTFDPAIFRQLHKAYLARNDAGLRSAWKKASRFNPAA